MSNNPSNHVLRTFMVVGTLRPDVDHAELAAAREEEHARLDVLRSEGRVGSHHVAPARNVAFMEVLAAEEAEVEDLLTSLPFSRFFDTDVFSTTTLVETAADAGA